jgi:RND family efflux transporter MFP subunit
VKAAVAACLFVTLIVGGCASPPERTVEERAPVAVAVQRVDVEDVSSPFEAGGVVRARTTALIASRVLAPITDIHVRPGDRVRRGAALVTLDARSSQADLVRAEAASLSAAEAARAAEADVRTAESAVVLARVTHERMASLHARRSATAQELDQAVAALTGAEAQHSSAQARRAAATAARDAAQAAAQAAAVASTYAVLVAPFDGLVTERNGDPGTMAQPGARLLTLEDLSSFRLEVHLDEARAAFVQVGDAVPVRIDSAADDAHAWLDGHLAEISRVDPESHAFLAKIDLPARAWRSGLFGRARFPGPVRRALTVTRSAVVARGQLTFVYLVDSDGRARLRPISIGPSDEQRAEVLAGLRAGDVVVADPPASLVDGARVSGGSR